MLGLGAGETSCGSTGLVLCRFQVLNLRFEFRDPFEHRPDGRHIYFVRFR